MARALLIGGCDERLKVALISEALRSLSMIAPFSKVLLVRDHYDSRSFETGGVHIREEMISGGCFCCSSKQDFERLLRETKGLEQMVVEVPITADAGIVAASIRAMTEGSVVSCLFAFDSSSLEVMMDALPELMERNIRSADALAWREQDEVDPWRVLQGRWHEGETLRIGQVDGPAIRVSWKDRRLWPFA